MTATQTDEQILAEGLWHFGLERKDLERHRTRVWSVTEGTLRIETAEGPLLYTSGDRDLLRCAEGHEYFRWAGECMQCLHKRKHSLDPAASYATKKVLLRIQMRLAQRKKRIESAKTGATPGPRHATWGGPNWARSDA